MRRAPLVAAVTVLITLTAGLPASAAPADHAVAGVYAPKAKPLPGSGVAAATRFLYAEASQRATSGGAYGLFDVARPELSTADFHSLAELAVSSADGRQIVEVGWTVDRAINRGSIEPHLFVFHWVDGKPGCYNGCGFVSQPGGGGPAGRQMTPGEVPYFAIRHAPGAWWISADGLGWLGYFPDSLWGGRFTQAGVQKWFGEVAASTAAPCTDMGNGRPASSGSASGIRNIGLLDSTARPNIRTRNTHPRYYTARRIDATSMRYGGPGAC